MPAAFGALRDDDVGTSLRRAFGLRDVSGHVSDDAAGFVRTIELRAQILPRPRPSELHHRRPQVEGGGKAVFPRVEQKKIRPERLVGLLPDRGDAFADLLRGQVMAAHGAEAAGIANGGRKLRRRCRPHAAQRDRVFDIQKFAELAFVSSGSPRSTKTINS